ncbi:MAG: chloride channel protein, partial [Chitinophagaceae bacterium]
VVGLVGFIEPRTLGVGYTNISNILQGDLTFQLLLSIGLFKFISWAIALGSGTSGGTLAPLMTIGSAAGAILGIYIMQWFPSSGLTVSLAALVGMSAMFTGASRAFITSVIFALEITGQSNALLPLLATCSASYIVSFFLMKNTIMTEKISRRGVRTPDSYEPDILEGISVHQVMDTNGLLLGNDNTIRETIDWLQKEPSYQSGHYIVCDTDGNFAGIINSSQLFNRLYKPETLLSELVVKNHVWVGDNFSLRRAIEIMAEEDVDVLPVFSEGEEGITGILSYKNILSSYRTGVEEHRQKQAHISLKRTGLKLLVRGQKLKRFIKSPKSVK